MFNRLVDTMDIEVIEINQQIAKKAAQIRAGYKGFKAMDALQLAVASSFKCDLFLTNDKQLRQFKEIKCITVDELL
jgi:predicted nucleic acid-binding protein